ncbi:MAG: cation diffusion facilitator family transporter [Thermoleophilia bacterium]|nr:cation diffusion facilitator family transporter [Thermoleophilia bacterium]
MSDAHAHSHAPATAQGHSHAHAPSGESLAGNARARRALWFALVVGLGVLVAEIVAGLVFGSLALLGDAAHMVTDVSAYAIALWAARMSMRPPSATRTFGLGRLEILAALANGATLLAASAWIAFESVRRLVDPPTVDGSGMGLVAAIGLLANVAVLAVLWRSGSSGLNVRAAMLHAGGDLLGSVAAVAAGIVITFTGFDRADPIASLALSLLIVVGAWRLVRASADVLLDAAPAGIDADRVGSSLVTVDGVLEVHDVHVWTMAPGTVAASAHVRVGIDRDPSALLDDMQSTLASDHGIRHSTLQVRADRGSERMETVPLMAVEDAVEWATDHIARLHPDMTRGVIAAAAGAAALGIAADGRVSPVAVTSRALGSLQRSAAD